MREIIIKLFHINVLKSLQVDEKNGNPYEITNENKRRQCDLFNKKKKQLSYPYIKVILQISSKINREKKKVNYYLEYLESCLILFFCMVSSEKKNPLQMLSHIYNERLKRKL